MSGYAWFVSYVYLTRTQPNPFGYVTPGEGTSFFNKGNKSRFPRQAYILTRSSSPEHLLQFTFQINRRDCSSWTT